jgi:hypothetical protein
LAYRQPAHIQLLPATMWISTKVVIRSIPIHWTTVLAVRIFPATMRTFTKDTALSENGRGTAWHAWINAAQQSKGTAWAWHGMCELALKGLSTRVYSKYSWQKVVKMCLSRSAHSAQWLRFRLGNQVGVQFLAGAREFTLL